MATAKAKGSSQAARKPSSKKRSTEMLSTCPVDGAGWCPYPFSIEQLRKRMKNQATVSEATEPEETESPRLVRSKK